MNRAAAPANPLLADEADRAVELEHADEGDGKKADGEGRAAGKNQGKNDRHQRDSADKPRTEHN